MKPTTAVIGYEALSRLLATLGVRASPSALETRRRRYDLPCRGLGIRGRRVEFSADDVDRWCTHLLGRTLGEAKSDRDAAASSAPRTGIRRPRRRRERPLLLLPTTLFAATDSTPARGEQVTRDDRGVAAAAFESIDLEGYDFETPTSTGYWRYSRVREATKSDLYVPTTRPRRAGRRPATTLLGAFLREESRLRWLRLPGKYFGLPPKTDSIALASPSLPGFVRALAWFRERNENAIFVAWTRREEVEPITLERPRPAIDMEDLMARARSRTIVRLSEAERW